MIDEKILIERLEEKVSTYESMAEKRRIELRSNLAKYNDGIADGIEVTIDIVEDLAEEYNNGWIPCKRELPGINGTYLVTCKDIPIPQMRYFDFIDKWDSINAVIAWQPLPAPYQKEVQHDKS